MPGRLWHADEIETLLLVVGNGGTIRDAANLLPNRTLSATKYKAGSIGIKTRLLWNDNHTEILEKHYPSSTYSEIQELLPDFSIQTINQKAHYFGIKKKKSAIRRGNRESHVQYEPAVDEITNGIVSGDAATLYGFILADGHVSKETNVVKLGISQRDLPYLEKINKYLVDNQPIKQYPSDNGRVTLSICSPLLVEFLYDNTDFSYKSADLKYPSFMIGHKYENEFIRGLFEGDGSISKTRGNCNYKFKMIGTTPLVYQLQLSISSILPGVAQNKLYPEKRTSLDLSSLEYGCSDTSRIGEMMYRSVICGDSVIWMERKFSRFKELWSKWHPALHMQLSV